MHVAYASDAAALPGAFSSMLSLAEHIEEPAECVIHLIVPVADLALAGDMLKCFRHALAPAKQAVKTELQQLLPQPWNSTEVLRLAGRDRPELRGPLTFARFFLDEYLPEASRVLWLDTDTVVKADIAPLFQMPMNHTVAAVLEDPLHPGLGLSRHRRGAPTTQVRGLFQLLAAERYFNPGVLLVDLRRWRAEAVAKGLVRWLQQASGYQQDMLALNLQFRGGIDALDPLWNVQGRANPVMCPWPQSLVEGAHVLHWTCGSAKPWQTGHQGHLYAPYALGLDRCPGLESLALLAAPARRPLDKKRPSPVQKALEELFRRRPLSNLARR